MFFVWIWEQTTISRSLAGMFLSTETGGAGGSLGISAKLAIAEQRYTEIYSEFRRSRSRNVESPGGN